MFSGCSCLQGWRISLLVHHFSRSGSGLWSLCKRFVLQGAPQHAPMFRLKQRDTVPGADCPISIRHPKSERRHTVASKRPCWGDNWLWAVYDSFGTKVFRCQDRVSDRATHHLQCLPVKLPWEWSPLYAGISGCVEGPGHEDPVLLTLIYKQQVKLEQQQATSKYYCVLAG